MLRGQMSPWQLESVLNVHRNLPLKFHQNRVSNSWDIADIEFLWWWVVQSHFIVKPNLALRLDWGFDNKAHGSAHNVTHFKQRVGGLTTRYDTIHLSHTGCAGTSKAHTCGAKGGIFFRGAIKLKNVLKSGKSPKGGEGSGQPRKSKSPQFKIWTFW